MKRTFGLTAMALASGCSLSPKYVRPAPTVPANFKAGDARADAASAALAYRAVFRDARLQSIIARALANNQNLRAALANVEAARALYRVQRAALLPTVAATGGVTVRDGGTGGSSGGSGSAGTTGSTGRGGQTTSFTADVGASAFELDLFGRVRSLSAAALDSYLATEAGARATRLTLVADTASAYYTLATDRSLLAISNETAAIATRSVTLTRARLQGGISPRTELRQAETILETARADAANLAAIVQQDRDAIDLLIGAPSTDADVPPSIETVGALVAPPPVGLDSSILLRRPDVVQAEYQLQAANARIGAARAAFFPRISLTGIAGFASTALSSLFSGGAFSYSAGPALSLPIFDGGANRGNLAYTRAQADAAVATYQRAIQLAFRDVADALARRATLADQLGAQVRLEAAARDSAFLTDARYRGGVASFLESLDAQRQLFTARRSLANTRLVGALNAVAIYRSLGGDPTLG